MKHVIADVRSRRLRWWAATLACAATAACVRKEHQRGDVAPPPRPSAAPVVRQPAPPTGCFRPAGPLSESLLWNGHTATLLPNGKVLIAGTEYSGKPELFDPVTNTFSLTGPASATFGSTTTLLPDGLVLVTGAQKSYEDAVGARLYDPDKGTFVAAGSLLVSRQGHTTTRLRSGEVLFAGGDETQEYVSVRSAEIFDPGTRRFRPTRDMTEQRSDHTATLLADGRVLLVGGHGSRLLDSAEVFDPATGQFATTGSLAVGRMEHSAVLLTDGRVLIVGGSLNNGKTLASAEVYDPATGSFTPTGALLTARREATATLLPDGRVVVAGGQGDAGPERGSPRDVELYDPDSGKFTRTCFFAHAMDFHSATRLPDGRVLFVGYDNSAEGTGDTHNAELFDPVVPSCADAGRGSAATGAGFSAPAAGGSAFEMRVPRTGHTATLLPDGRVLVLGGSSSTRANADELASPELYDPATRTFTRESLLLIKRWDQTATMLPSGQVLLVGGNGPAQLYDPRTCGWLEISPPVAARSNHTATLLADGQILIAGGTGGEDDENVASAELFDPATRRFSATGAMSAARSSHTATRLPDGKVVVAGGSGAGDSVEIYDPALRAFKRSGSLCFARRGHTATLLDNGKVLLVGGDDYGVPELYDPAAVTCAEISCRTLSRRHHTATKLPDGKVLIAGGKAGRPSGRVQATASVEIYDPKTNTFASAPPLARPRRNHTATLLGDGQVLLLGGMREDEPLADAELYRF